jgi:hypothetical protein
VQQSTANIDETTFTADKKNALETDGPDGSAPFDGERSLSVLKSYSEGRTSRRRAMDEIGLAPDRYSDFVELMERHDVPWPKVDRSQIEREAEIVVEADPRRKR